MMLRLRVAGRAAQRGRAMGASLGASVAAARTSLVGSQSRRVLSAGGGPEQRLLGDPPPFVTLDVETNGLAHPVKATCAVTVSRGGDDDDYGEKVTRWHSDYAPLMSAETAGELVNFLFNGLSSRQVVTFNGGFDFGALYNALEPDSPEADRARLLAMASRDIFTSFVVSHGHFVSLKAVVEANGLGARHAGGADMPRMWASGSREEQDAVIAHCENDALLTADVYALACRDGELWWRTRRGEIRRWPVPADDDGTIVPPAWAAMKPHPGGVDETIASKYAWTGLFDQP